MIGLWIVYCPVIWAEEGEETTDRDINAEYFEAHDRAVSEGKPLLVYFSNGDDSNEFRQEFDNTTLEDPGIKDLLDEKFVFLSLPKGEAIGYSKIEWRTRYVTVRGRWGRRRQEARKYQVDVGRSVFGDESRRTGFVIVNPKEKESYYDVNIIHRFYFETPSLSPHVFKLDNPFQPWTREVFSAILQIPVTSREEYSQSLEQNEFIRKYDRYENVGGRITSLGGYSYDYGHTRDNLAEESVQVRLSVGSMGSLSDLASEGKPVDLRCDVYSLSNTAAPVKMHYAQVPVDNEWHIVEIPGLNPETVYRFNIYLYKHSSPYQLVGEIGSPFYAATKGPTEQSEAQAYSVMRGLYEVNYWRTHRSIRRSYMQGRWCMRFYQWLIGARFSGWRYRWGGGALPRISRTQNIMGTHGRVESRSMRHSFMILSYDQHRSKRKKMN